MTTNTETTKGLFDIGARGETITHAEVAKRVADGIAADVIAAASAADEQVIKQEQKATAAEKAKATRAANKAAKESAAKAEAEAWTAAVQSITVALTTEHNSRWAVGDLLVALVSPSGRPVAAGVNNGKTEILTRLSEDLRRTGMHHVSIGTLNDSYATALAFPAEYARHLAPFSTYRTFAVQSDSVARMDAFLLDGFLNGKSMTVKEAQTFNQVWTRKANAAAEKAAREAERVANEARWAAERAAKQAALDAETPEQKAERARLVKEQQDAIEARRAANEAAEKAAAKERANEKRKETNARKAAEKAAEQERAKNAALAAGKGAGTQRQTGTQKGSQGASGASGGITPAQEATALYVNRLEDAVRALDAAARHRMDAPNDLPEPALGMSVNLRTKIDALLTLLTDTRSLSAAAIQTRSGIAA